MLKIVIIQNRRSNKIVQSYLKNEWKKNKFYIYITYVKT